MYEKMNFTLVKKSNNRKKSKKLFKNNIKRNIIKQKIKFKYFENINNVRINKTIIAKICKRMEIFYN